MKNEELKDLFQEDFYSQIKFEEVTGRYITNDDLNLVLEKLADKYPVEEIGRSVEERSINMITLGGGKTKILAWSQMHGNEGTTTKAVFDLLNAFAQNDRNEVFEEILNLCTFIIIPILNPDGAAAYTRVNSNEVDLNRDMQDLSQPESRILMEQFHRFNPNFCLNLHDQRTIFSAGEVAEPATLSFLTPSKDKERSIDDFRKQSMSLIAGIAEDLSNELPGRIGRYDDAFNINCAGDTFQHLSVPTVLFEAGHFPGDYEREVSRKYVFKALISCIYQIAVGAYEIADYESYFKIPENQKLFNDVIIRRAKFRDGIKDVSIQFKEILKGGKIDFVPVVEKIQENISKYPHREIDAAGAEIKLPNGVELDENVVVNKIILNNEKIQVKYQYISN
ncbi:DUF2817 domain-containing protein [Gramella sp. MT6]|uniref:M14 family zinc carboxypeptidase n=1 Tax=Gramella sp. MT6 TaxID=2705471 RepID=UPI001C5E4125|nr:DUF2817 domain-containing protein [Gramella sp. MT6]QYA26554.1 DUF2817 domain-containing protein [Gramella sp. MT6]